MRLDVSAVKEKNHLNPGITSSLDNAFINEVAPRSERAPLDLSFPSPS